MFKRCDLGSDIWVIGYAAPVIRAILKRVFALGEPPQYQGYGNNTLNGSFMTA
jgi:hypothetical protein